MLWGPLTRLGLAVAAASAVADQASKLWLLYVFDIRAVTVWLMLFLDLVLVWNKGSLPVLSSMVFSAGAARPGSPRWCRLALLPGAGSRLPRRRPDHRGRWKRHRPVPARGWRTYLFHMCTETSILTGMSSTSLTLLPRVADSSNLLGPRCKRPISTTNPGLRSAAPRWLNAGCREGRSHERR